MSSKVTLTGHFTLLDGTPAVGTVLVRPSRSPILDLDGKQVISGPQRFTLDEEGRFSVDLPPTDDPALGENFTYHVMVTMHHSNWQVIGLTLPADMISVDVLDPPAGAVKEYPTRAEWDALTGVAVAEMGAALGGAETARDVTVDARDATVVARDETLVARDVTLTARDTAVGAAGETETARTETLTARDTTLTARDETVEARDATLTARSETITTAGEAESARDTAVGAAGEAETARDEAVGAAGEAETARLSAWEAVDTPGRQGPRGDSDVEQLAGVARLTNMVHDIEWWPGEDVTIHSQEAGTIKFTATARLGHIRWRNLMVVGKIYYVSAEVKATSDRVFFGTSARPVYHSGSGDWERLTGMVTPTYRLFYQVRDNRPSGWDQIEVRDPVLIDLTAVFGAGREPSKEYMDELLAKHGNYIGGVDQFVVGDALKALMVVGPGLALRYDTTVGECVFLDHPGGSTMLYGDTGWRTLSSWDTTGTITGTELPTGIAPLDSTAGAIQIRRIDGRVYWRLTGFTLTAVSQWSAPSGFRAATSRVVPVRIDGSPGFVQIASWGWQVNAEGGFPRNGHEHWATVFDHDAPTAWPTTLPGTPSQKEETA